MGLGVGGFFVLYFVTHNKEGHYIIFTTQLFL